MLTKEQIEEWKRRIGTNFNSYDKADLSDAVEALLAEREELIGLLREIEWCSDHDEWPNFCPVCHHDPEKTHAPDCRLAAFLS